MAKAYSYVRFSTPEQSRGDSLRRQMAPAREYAEQHGLELDDAMRDEGRSAYRGRHREDDAALGAFLAQVDAGEVSPGSFLLVESFDRLSREKVTTALRLFLNLLEKEIVIVTLGDGRRYSSETVSSNPMELLISIVIMMRAHDESHTKAQRVGAAWANKRLLAATQGKAMTEICPAWLERTGDHYCLIPERAEVVRRIFRMSIEGLGSRSIARLLNTEGVPVFGRGRMWYDSYIKKVLGNQAVIGRFVPGAASRISEPDAAVEGYFPAVVDDDTFYCALNASRARAASSIRHPPGKVRNLLSGLSRCQECASGMHYIDKGKKGGRPYLQCGSSRLAGGCRNKFRYDYQKLELGLLVFGEQAREFGSSGTNEARSNGLEVRREELQARLGRLLDLLEAGETPIRSVRERVEKLENQLLVAEEELKVAKIEDELNSRNQRRESVESFLLAYNRLRSGDSPDLRRKTSTALRRVIRNTSFTSSGLVQFELSDGNVIKLQFEGCS